MGVNTANLEAMKTYKRNETIELENEEALDQEDNYATGSKSDK